MQHSVKGIIVGVLALAGATFATAEAEAMPVQPLATVASTSVEPVYYYGYRRPLLGYRRFGYRRFGYRPYGYRRPFYGYRRPFYGYGYRRF